MPHENNELEPMENQKVILGMLGALVVIGLVVGGGYLYAKKQSGQQVFPSGYQAPIPTDQIDCGQPKPSSANIWDYYNKCDPIKLGPDSKMVPHTDTKYNFTINIPDNIKLSTIGNGYGITYKEIAPNINHLYLYDPASGRQGELATLTGEDYVRNYWRQYSGLTGVKILDKIINSNGLTAYKAVYVIGGKTEGNQEVFFETKAGSGDFIHFTRGIIDPAVYDSIINSFKFTPGNTK